MQLGELKPILAGLVLPPLGPLLLALLALAWARKRRGAGLALAAACIVLTLALSCNAVAVLLARTLLPQVPPVRPEQLQAVQAIVVLGAAVDSQAPEYGGPQLEGPSHERLRYAVWLARRSGKPLAYAGGQGWVAQGSSQPPEAQVADAVLRDEYGLALRWRDDRSRDTRENAEFMMQAMKPDGIRRVAVVTDAWHMPRAIHYFRAAGFDVLPAPMGFPHYRIGIQKWLPDPEALLLSRQVLREWLALQVARIP
jgi:uncharacterized SAM-binding protein YcdF (DUF218 family)